MLPETFDVLEQSKLINKQVLSGAIASLLIPRHVDVIEEIDEKALTFDEIRVALWGQGYSPEAAHELNKHVTNLTRSHGPVHYALDNGHADYLLLSAKVHRKAVTQNGVETVLPMTGRFVSNVPAIVAMHSTALDYRRAGATLERIVARSDEDVMRLPGLASFLPRLNNELWHTVRRELPPPENAS